MLRPPGQTVLKVNILALRPNGLKANIWPRPPNNGLYLGLGFDFWSWSRLGAKIERLASASSTGPCLTSLLTTTSKQEK